MGEETDSGIFTIATQGSITFVGSILGKALGFTFVAVATRLVTQSEYGIITLSLSIVMFVQGFASLNIYRSVDYFLPQFLSDSNLGKAKKTLQNVFLIGIMSSIVGALVVFILREQLAEVFDEPGLTVVLPFMILLIPLQTTFRTLITSFNSIKKMKYRVPMKDLLNPLMKVTSLFIFVAAGAGLLSLVGSYLVGLMIAVICGFAFPLYEADWVRGAKTESISNRSLVSYSLPLVFAGVIYSLTGQVDYFVIGYFLESAEVGQYRVGELLAANLLIVLRAVTPVFKPMVAESRNNASILESRYQLVTRWVTMCTIPLAVTLTLAPDVYLSLFFTEQYSVASTAVVALTVGYLLNASFGPEGMILEGLGHTWLTLFNTVVLISVNAILDILLVPRLGILGAGIATGAALTVAGAVGVSEIYYLRSIHPFSWNLVRVWIAIIPTYLVGSLIIAIEATRVVTALVLPAVVVGSYVFGLYVTGAFSEEDKKIASRIDAKLGYNIVSPIVS